MPSDKQKGVLRGMLIGVALTVLGVGGAILWQPTWFLPSPGVAPLAFALSWDLLVLLCLMLNIGLLARHRFFTPEDIDGGGLTPGTAKAQLLQSQLQNTLEQTVLAIPVHLAWAVLMPAVWLGAIPAAALLFFLGRLLFWQGYARGAPSRAAGFAMTFYPSILMLVIMAAFQVLQRSA